MQSTELRLTRGLLAGSLTCSIVLVFALAMARTSWAAVLLGLILTGAGLWFLTTYLYRKQRPIGWLLSIAVLNLAVVVPELALTLADFRYESRIEFGWPRPSAFWLYEADEKLWWKLRPSDSGVNSLGFPGREIVVPKPPGVRRIVFLGDSVTQQGYPDFVEHFLNTKRGTKGGAFESLTFAVAGYSSHQGRILAETYGLKYEPALAFVYFGWNDHWQAYGSVDSEKVVRVSRSRWTRIGQQAYHHSRVLQGLNAIRGSLGGMNASTGEVRVPAERYRRNLQAIQQIFEGANVPIVFITAPTSHDRLGVPDYLIQKHFSPDKQSVVRLHREFNQIVREVARRNGSYLLDLEGEFAASSNESLRALFMADGIHLTPIGLGVTARRIADFIENDVGTSVLEKGAH